MATGDGEGKLVQSPVAPNKDNGSAVTKEGSEPAPTIGKFTDPQPQDIVLDELDQLKAENMQLRITTLSQRKSALLKEAEHLDNKEGEMMSAYMKFIGELGKKYGFDPTTTEMQPGTGLVVPRGTVDRGNAPS